MEALDFSIEGEKGFDDDLAILCTYFLQESDCVWGALLIELSSEKEVQNQSLIDNLQNPRQQIKQADMTDRNEPLTSSIMAQMKTIFSEEKNL